VPPEETALALLAEALARLESGFARLPPHAAALDAEGVRAALLAAADRLKDNYPYHHPLYVGQMLKPPHPVARLAYALASWINPNNHALDGGRASSAMEKEAVARLAALVGWGTHLGHLCGGGTMANLEALWVARELRPGRAILASAQAHYTHERLAALLGVPFRKVPVDRRGRMDPARLAAEIGRGDVGTVVATMGTTATGAVDPLPALLALRAHHDVRVHADAAYGGFFLLARNLHPETREALASMREADSIAIDPHKHGLQPYGCGCVLFRDPSVGRLYRHESPYTYFTSDDLHLGEISLECSRPGAAAVALWATQHALPYEVGGAFAGGLEACRTAATRLADALAADARFAPLAPPSLDIVVWAVRAASAGAASDAARRVFDEAAKRDLHLALAAMPREMVETALPNLAWDRPLVTCLRACVMKPEHVDWLDEILARLDAAAVAAGIGVTHRGS